MTSTDWVGYLAAFLTTCSFVPQAWHTFRTRDVGGISLGMYTAFAIGVALWLAYGVLLHAWPIVLANGATLSLALAILAMKVRFGAGRGRKAEGPRRALHRDAGRFRNGPAAGRRRSRRTAPGRSA